MNEISHKKARRWIQKTNDAMLSDKEAVLLAEHVAGCDDCRHYQKELEDLQVSIRASLQRQAAVQTRHSPQRADAKQPVHLVQKLRRTIQMKKIQKITYAFVGVLAMAVLVFVGINLGQQFMPTPGLEATAMPIEPSQGGFVVATPLATVSATLDAVSIDFYFNSLSTREKSAMKALVYQFNQIHKNEIVIHQTNDYPELAGEGGYYQGMSALFDCYVTQADPRGAALSDAVLDLNAWMEAEDTAFQLDFDPTILDAARYEGSLSALPLSIQPAIMVYNADLLAQQGGGPPLPIGRLTNF